jgi:rRNA-processing protein FCF1
MGLFGSDYCIDTSALIDLRRRKYAPDVFRSLWERIEELVKSGRIISHQKVFEELKKLTDKSDNLLKWAKVHKRMFISLDGGQSKNVLKILEVFPRLIDQNRETEEADPFVIALAMIENRTIITSEQPAYIDVNKNARPKIPDVCKHYKVPCIYDLLEFFRQEKWEF